MIEALHDCHMQLMVCSTYGTQLPKDRVRQGITELQHVLATEDKMQSISPISVIYVAYQYTRAHTITRSVSGV